MKCKCGKKIKFGKVDKSGKKHAHCRTCQLEWHNTGKYVYSHPHAVKRIKRKTTRNPKDGSIQFVK